MQRFVSLIAPCIFPTLLPALPFVGLVVLGGDTWNGILAAVTLGAAYVCASLPSLFGVQRQKKSFLPASLLGIPIFLAAVVSALPMRSSFTVTNFFGQGFELGTLGSFLLIALTVAFCVYATRNESILFLGAISLVSTAVSLCALLLWLGVSFFSPLAALAPQVSFFLCAGMLTTALIVDSRQRYRAAYAVAAALSFVGILIFFNPIAAYVGSVVAFANVLYFFRSEVRPSFATFPFAAALVATALLLSNVFGVGAPRVAVPLDIHPSLLATEYIIGPEYLPSVRLALLGTGPDSLSYAWNLYRPVELNAGSRWQVTPDSTFSTATTLAIEVGILGLFAFFLLPLGVLFTVTSVRPSQGSVREVLFSLVLFTFGAALFYSVDLLLVLLGAAALGLSFSEGYVQRDGDWSALGRRTIFLITVIAMCVGLSLVLAASLQGRAAYYVAQGQAALEKNNPDGASILFDKAVTSWPAAPYLRADSFAYARKLFGRIKDGGGISDPVALRHDADRGVLFAERATGVDSRNYALWIFRGSLMTSLVQFGYPGAIESAEVSFLRAGALAPNQPEVLYMQALLSVAVGNPRLASEDLHKALTLKPDYKDAINLLHALK